jgi:gas vesicle protein
MSEKNIQIDNTVVAPFLAGGILGAGIALLLAPKPGKELRKDVKRLARDVKRFSANAGDRVTGAIEKGKDIVEDGAARFADVIEDGKAVFVGQKKRLTGLIKPQRSIIGPVLAGSVGGAALALLLAPKAGKELRQDVKSFASAAGDQVSSAAHKGIDLYEQGKAKVAGAVETGTGRLREVFAS